ncbi:MAG: helix-turn-helix domain-containing protein [Methylocystis sp.]
MYIRTTKELGALIREARLGAGLTQAELARRLGSSQGWISEIEQGKERADLGMVLKAMSILGMHLDVSFDQTVGVAGVTATARAGEVAVTAGADDMPYSLDEIV